MKKKNMKKINILIIAVMLVMIIANVLPIDNNIYAALNTEGNDEKIGMDDALGGIVSYIFSAGLGIMATPIASLVNFFNILIFTLLYTVFTASGITTGFNFPFPDKIVFNRLAFFDPNFINPTGKATAPVQLMQGTISGLYYSCFTIAVTIFVVSALVVGIKLAVSSIASEKAQYKAAVTKWVFGIFLLFTVHYLMAGIFAINEKVVEIASNVVAEEIKFNVNPLNGIPLGIGKKVSTLLKGVDDIIKFFGGEASITEFTDIEVKGMTGLILQLLVNATGGDLISSIMCAILLGQVVALVVQYIKRLFYCIFLGVLAPLVVAVDVIKKSMG